MVDINIKLNNSGEEAVCLSEGATGNISFTSVTKDGKEVKTRPAVSYFLESISMILQGNLVSVEPGNSLDFNLFFFS